TLSTNNFDSRLESHGPTNSNYQGQIEAATNSVRFSPFASDSTFTWPADLFWNVQLNVQSSGPQSMSSNDSFGFLIRTGNTDTVAPTVTSVFGFRSDGTDHVTPLLRRGEPLIIGLSESPDPGRILSANVVVKSGPDTPNLGMTVR